MCNMCYNLNMNDIIKQGLIDLPLNSGVYIMKGRGGQILYIGKAKNLKSRVSQYFGSATNKTDKVLAMVAKIEYFEYIITNNEIEALVLENNLIKQHKPPYNILLKDDKSYPFIKIDVKQDFPRVEVVRKLKADGAKYFGPYMIGITSKDIVDLLYGVFPLRECQLDMKKVPKSHKPCLNYYIGRCKAPCKGLISKDEYAKIIADVVSFLNGNDKRIAELLTGKMNVASEKLDFELALFYKQKLDILDKLVRKQVTALPKDFNLDVFSVAANGLNTVVAMLFVRGGKLVGGDKQVITDVTLNKNYALSNYITQYYETIKYMPDEIITSSQLEDADIIEEYLSGLSGNKVRVVTPIQGARKQLCDMADNNSMDFLEKSLSIAERQDNMTIGAILQLQEFLKMENMPIRIECYDISHISGTLKVGSMVVFCNGERASSHYRKFKIKEVEGNNDFASLQETIKRRFTRLLDPAEEDESFSKKPDLVVIDGGKGQLSSVLEIFDGLGIKDIRIISLAEREEEVFVPGSHAPLVFSKDSYALKLLQRIRDEAHRFAITFHRDLRKNKQTHSRLMDITGVGEKRFKLLMKSFQTIENIKNATFEKLLLIKGIDSATAQNIIDYFESRKNKQ